MIKIKAKIRLNNARTLPILSGYTPAFNFLRESKVGGRINLLNRDRLWPGEEASVNINFPDKKYLGDDFVVGKKFTFDEGNTNVGEGIIEGIDEVTEGF